MEQQQFLKSVSDSVWRGEFATLKEFYDAGGAYDPEMSRRQYERQYYEFDKYELSIDPDEPLENVEAYSPTRQRQEIIKCSDSFAYFCHKYIKILHPMRGLIPFVLFKYQKKTIRDYESHRFNIISKFRQGGLTTVTLLTGDSPVKGYISMVLGLMLAVVGFDIISGDARFAFGIPEMMDGIDFLPVAIGLFGLGEVLAGAEAPKGQAIRGFHPSPPILPACSGLFVSTAVTPGSSSTR